MKGRYDNGVPQSAQKAVVAPVYGAVATLESRTLLVLAGAESPDDAAELIKERRLEVLDLGQLWHAVHWILARRAGADPADPLSWAVVGRTRLPALDRGRGAPGMVEPEKMAAVVAALGELGTKTARLRFDPAAMDDAGIHPGTWRTAPIARAHELLDYLKPLHALYRRAMKQGAGAVGYRY